MGVVRVDDKSSHESQYCAMLAAKSNRLVSELQHGSLLAGCPTLRSCVGDLEAAAVVLRDWFLLCRLAGPKHGSMSRCRSRNAGSLQRLQPRFE